MHVRTATPRDIPQLLELVRRYWEFEHLEGFLAVRVERSLSQLLTEPRLGTAWVVEGEAGLVGYLLAVLVLSIEHGGIMAEIDEFFVLPEVRSHGLGTRLLETAEAALAARGCVRLQLQLAVGNAAGRAFYERRGYRGRDGYRLLDKALASKSATG
jgi:GNAT superfamily N-acetyltransferase